MVKIEYFYTDRMYKYLWLKYVTGTNLSVHCARCLLGEYEERFKAYMRSIYNLELRDAPVYYLCGVAYDRIWRHNLHVAFVPAAGQEIIIDNDFCRLKIVNARRLEISTRFIDWSNPLSRRKDYHTCRNWQFASMLAKGLHEPYPGDPRSDVSKQNTLDLFDT